MTVTTNLLSRSPPGRPDARIPLRTTSPRSTRARLKGVYGWIWRVLPGGRAGKSAGALLLFLVVLAVLFLIVFPLVEPHLGLNDVTVNR